MVIACIISLLQRSSRNWWMMKYKKQTNKKNTFLFFFFFPFKPGNSFIQLNASSYMVKKVPQDIHLSFLSFYQTEASFHKEKQTFKKQTSITDLLENNYLFVNLLELGRNRKKESFQILQLRTVLDIY